MGAPDQGGKSGSVDVGSTSAGWLCLRERQRTPVDSRTKDSLVCDRSSMNVLEETARAPKATSPRYRPARLRTQRSRREARTLLQDEYASQNRFSRHRRAAVRNGMAL